MKLIFQKLIFFYELAKDGEVIPTKPHGLPLPVKQDPEEQKSKPGEFAYSSAKPP